MTSTTAAPRLLGRLLVAYVGAARYVLAAHGWLTHDVAGSEEDQ